MATKAQLLHSTHRASSVFLVLICIFQVGLSQALYENSAYEGYAHYVTYDDYSERAPVVRNPFEAIRGYEKEFDKDMMMVPELVLKDPNPRDNTSPLPINEGPCGRTERGMVYYSGFPGRSNLIRWKIIHPIVNGNCTIRLSNGLDESDQNSFNVLFPVFDFSMQNQDGTYDYYAGEEGNYYRKFYEGGKFSCGRVDPGSFESITVQFPDMTWDECTLQLIVETNEGNIYQCADIEIINSDMKDCLGNCQNEGVCVNGKCLCRSGFMGDRCEYRTQEKRTYTPWIAIVFLILLAIIVAIAWYIALKFVSQKEKWVTKRNDPRKSQHYPDAGLAL